MAERKNLSLCLITNNDEKYIADCIKEFKNIADEVVIADIGSTDSTVETAKLAGASVFQMEWGGSFSGAKNFCMEHASGRWVLFLDADELISQGDLKKLEPLLNNPNVEGYLLYVDYNPQERPISSPVQSLRLIRNRKEYSFQYKSFEAIPNELIANIRNTSIRILHRGSTTLSWQIRSRITLLQQDIIEFSEDGYVQYIYGIELLNQQKFDDSVLCFQKALKNISFDFLYAPHLYKCLSWSLLYLKRYKDALEVLNEGVNNFSFYTDLLVLRGELHRQLKEYKEAIQDLNSCLKLRQQPVFLAPAPEIDICVIFEMLGQIHEEIFNFRQAIACYQQAYGINHDKELLLKMCKLSDAGKTFEPEEIEDLKQISELECVVWSRNFIDDLEKWLHKFKDIAAGNDILAAPKPQDAKKLNELLSFYQGLIDSNCNGQETGNTEPTCAEIHEKIGAFYEKKQNIGEAVTAYLRVLQWKPLNEPAQEKIKSFYDKNPDQINAFLKRKESVLEGGWFHHKKDFANYIRGVLSFKNQRFKEATAYFSQIPADETIYPVALAYIISNQRLEKMEAEAESLVYKNKTAEGLLSYIFDINKSYALCKLDEDFHKYQYSEQIQREIQRIRNQAFNAQI